MKLAVLALALAGAACGTPPPPADFDARVPGPVEGTWDVTWTCTDCQPGQINPLAYATQVAIGADAATYDNPDCTGCGDVHGGAPNGSGTCFEVDAGGPGGGDLSWSAYELCAFGDALEGSLTFMGYPGLPQPRTYALAGARRQP